MQIKYRQYPHPVLSYFSDDVVNCAFQSTLKVSPTKTTYKFDAMARTSSADIVQLINEKKAAYTFHVECASTRFRKMFSSYDEQFSFEIASDLLDGKVQVCAFILTNEDLPEYRNRNFHKDYERSAFRVRKGDVLAVDRDRSFDAEKSIDPLKKIPSIFRVVQNNDESAPQFDLELNDHKVIIKLSPDNYAMYKYLSQVQDLQPALAAMLIMPALVQLIEEIRRQSGSAIEFEDLRWFRVLKRRLKELGVNIEDDRTFVDSSLVLAQTLINGPLAPSLKTLAAYNED